jgi:hypothetical protein
MTRTETSAYLALAFYILEVFQHNGKKWDMISIVQHTFGPLEPFHDKQNG